MSFLRILQDDDMVYHYTTSENALLYIIKEMKLRLSPRANSFDPIENTDEFISYSGERDPDLFEIGRKIGEEIKNAKQLSFCKNKLNDPKAGIPTGYPFEKYGFAKPRMWDNYGDKYKGVCLVFSKSKLKQSIENTILFDNENGVEYLSYSEFSSNHQSIINKGTKDETYQYYIEHFKKRLFYKHVDYKMENEYRICSLSNEPFDYIDIKDALMGLIISDNGINEHLYEEFARVLSNKISLIISFKNKGLSLQTYQEYKRNFNSIEEVFEKINSKL